jgi:hypothetical protein
MAIFEKKRAKVHVTHKVRERPKWQLGKSHPLTEIEYEIEHNHLCVADRRHNRAERQR